MCTYIFLSFFRASILLYISTVYTNTVLELISTFSVVGTQLRCCTFIVKLVRLAVSYIILLVDTVQYYETVQVLMYY